MYVVVYKSNPKQLLLQNYYFSRSEAKEAVSGIAEAYRIMHEDEYEAQFS